MIKIALNNEGTSLAKVLHYYGLLEAGNEFKIVCPFHEDVNASMKINLNDGSFYCFGCGISGDALKFVSLINKHLDDLHACIEYNKVLYSNKVKAINIVRQAKAPQEDRQALIEAYDYYYGLKTIDWAKETGPIKDYMTNRGFTTQILNKTKAKLTYNESYPIIFPMLDLGDFKGWVCRTNLKTVEQKRKYLYNTGFSRRNTLVGDYDSEVVILVEGYMDRLKLIQLGLHKVAAILGWKITEQQISKLKKQGVKHIISALDNDTCGEKGTQYLKKFFNVIRFQYPEGVKDPGDLNKNNFATALQRTKKEFRRKVK